MFSFRFYNSSEESTATIMFVNKTVQTSQRDLSLSNNNNATCVDTLAPSHLQNTSKSAGSPAELAERIKCNKYRNLNLRLFIHKPLARGITVPFLFIKM